MLNSSAAILYVYSSMYYAPRCALTSRKKVQFWEIKNSLSVLKFLQTKKIPKKYSNILILYFTIFQSFRATTGP